MRPRRPGEKLVAPVKRASQCPLTSRKVPRASNEHRKAAVQSLEQLRRRKGGDARSRELDRQWEPVDAVADLPDHRIGLEASVRCEAALDEELHCVVGIERQDSILGLASQAESRAARDQYAKVLGFREQARHESTCLQEVLEVVEDEQESAAGECFDEVLPRVTADGFGDGTLDQLGSSQRSELDEVDAVAERVDEAGGGREGKARLAAAARAGKRHEPRGLNQTGHLLEFTLASDERCRQRGKVRVGRQRFRLRGESLAEEGDEPFGRGSQRNVPGRDHGKRSPHAPTRHVEDDQRSRAQLEVEREAADRCDPGAARRPPA